MNDSESFVPDFPTQTTAMDGPLGVFERLRYVNRIIGQLREPLRQPALVHLNAEGTPVVHTLGGETSFGRGGKADVAVTSAKMSSLHFRLVPGEDQLWRLEDMQSKNGTFLNGERLTRPRSIVWGDIVEAGEIAFVLLPPALQHKA